MLPKWLKAILTDTRSVVIGLIVTALISAIVINLRHILGDNLYESLLSSLQHMLLLSTPIWLSIAILAVVSLYTYVKIKLVQSYLQKKIEIISSESNEEKIYRKKQKFDKELLAYYEISEHLTTLQQYQQSLAGFDEWIIDLKQMLIGISESKKTRQETVNELRVLLNDYSISINKHSISIQENIYDSLKMISKTFERELSSLNAIGTMIENRENREIFSERINNYTILNAKIAEVRKMIRIRIEEMS